MSHSPSTPRLRIVVADDHPRVLDGLRELLESEFDVVGMAENGYSLVECVATSRPDVVVSDIQMPGMDGVEAARHILLAGWCDAVVLITMFDDVSLAERAIAMGARGFLLKLDAFDELIPAVHQARSGGFWLSKNLTVPP